MEVGVVVVGAGAAGLMAAIWAGRTFGGGARRGGGPGRVVVLDGAKKIGAKILVAGGGRCNVTHESVDERQYTGTSLHSIRNVLGRFTVEQTREFFAGLGVELKQEATGKLFPVSDDAHTVLDALVGECERVGGELVHPWRVVGIRRDEETRKFVVEGEVAGGGRETIAARRVVMATGGMALPRTGSDGAGYGLVRGLGHSVTGEVFPALVPLILSKSGVVGRELTSLSGLTLAAELELWSGGGKRLRSFANSTLFTHFGLSGPSVLDISRYYTAAKRQDAGAVLTLNVLPGVKAGVVEQALLSGGTKGVKAVLVGLEVAERLARSLITIAEIEAGATCASLRREQRLLLVRAVTALPLPIEGDRGFTFAEVTAGGVPLSEVNLATMESRVCPGLHLCGELLDVDGRVGGFNFQWAWASGYVAGVGAIRGCAE